MIKYMYINKIIKQDEVTNKYETMELCCKIFKKNVLKIMGEK
jgi:hypothetical protein